MADTVSKAKRSEIMSKIHQPTSLEINVHKWLCGQHIRHQMYPKVVGRPDLRLIGVRVPYVFIDGCFWHCCPLHYHRPKSRQEFWIPHVEQSNERREKARRELPYAWTRIWEHEIDDGTFKPKIASLLAEWNHSSKGRGK